MTERTVATIEARLGSSRLPGKVLLPLAGMPALAVMVERLSYVPELDGIVIATTENPADEAIETAARQLGVRCFRGSEEDVLGRVADAARADGIDVIVELTGDCPLIDPRLVSETIRAFREGGCDYVANDLEPAYPLGMCSQVFRLATLEAAERSSTEPRHREHVSLFIYEHPELFNIRSICAPVSLRRPDLRLTLDTREDLAVMSAVHGALRPVAADYSLADMILWLDDHPEVASLNSGVVQRSPAA